MHPRIFGVFEILQNGFKFFSELFTVALIGIFTVYVDVVMAMEILLIAGVCTDGKIRNAATAKTLSFGINSSTATPEARRMLTTKISPIIQTVSINLSIKNICWKYPRSDKYVLQNVSIVIEKGDSIALIGASGAGKTTLADVIIL